MRKYQPEILMGMILCMALTLLIRTHPAAVNTVPAAPPPKTMLAQTAWEAATAPASFDANHTIHLLHHGIVEDISLQDYLIGVILSEVPMSFEAQALQAQAIASRTFALHCRKHEDAEICGDSGCCQAWADQETLRERFGETFDAAQKKARQAVEETDSLVLTYDGALIDATFFSCSGGMTEDAVAVWGSEIPYLRSVDSPGEEIASCYHTSACFSPEEFSRIVMTEAPEASLGNDPALWIGEMRRTAGDGIAEVRIGGVPLSGMQLRRCFGLRSTRFTVEYDGSNFCFDVYGYGHRVGMSQYGAQAMALEGASAEEILKTYYTGVEIEPMQSFGI